jgi:hypothetical protein
MAITPVSLKVDIGYVFGSGQYHSAFRLLPTLPQQVCLYRLISPEIPTFGYKFQN